MVPRISRTQIMDTRLDSKSLHLVTPSSGRSKLLKKLVNLEFCAILVLHFGSVFDEDFKPRLWWTVTLLHHFLSSFIPRAYNYGLYFEQL